MAAVLIMGTNMRGHTPTATGVIASCFSNRNVKEDYQGTPTNVRGYAPSATGVIASCFSNRNVKKDYQGTPNTEIIIVSMNINCTVI
jgi:hypothetical protein